MLVVIYSLLAGIFITLQGVFNTRVSDKIGLWETTTIVHAFEFNIVYTSSLNRISICNA